MSGELLDFARRFAAGEMTADEFADTFIGRWNAEQKSGIDEEDSDAISECLSSIYCVADLYEPAEFRQAYSFDEAKLRGHVRNLINVLSGS